MLWLLKYLFFSFSLSVTRDHMSFHVFFEENIYNLFGLYSAAVSSPACVCVCALSSPRLLADPWVPSWLDWKAVQMITVCRGFALWFIWWREPSEALPSHTALSSWTSLSGFPPFPLGGTAVSFDELAEGASLLKVGLLVGKVWACVCCSYESEIHRWLAKGSNIYLRVQNY